METKKIGIRAVNKIEKEANTIYRLDLPKTALEAAMRKFNKKYMHLLNAEEKKIVKKLSNGVPTEKTAHMIQILKKNTISEKKIKQRIENSGLKYRELVENRKKIYLSDPENLENPHPYQEHLNENQLGLLEVEKDYNGGELL